MICLYYYLLCFLSNKLGEARGLGGRAEEQGTGRKMAQTIYTHMNK
jgi:hypothetical protein